jgi:hypothetical protein
MNEDSFFGRVLGNRSLASWILGDFFQQATNTSGTLAVVLVGSALYMFAKKGSLPDWLIAALFTVIGFYFGGVNTRHKPGP